MIEFNPIKTTAKSEKTVISIRLEIDKLEKIDKIANNADISRNELILQSIDFALNHLPNNSY